MENIKVFTLEELSNRYQNVIFIEGTPGYKDNHGTPYIKITLGGIIKEGSYIPSFCFANDDTCWEHFFFEFEKQLKDNKFVYIRKLPILYTDTIFRLDTFSCEIPQLLPLNRRKIDGRFTFYKELPQCPTK